MALFGSSMDLFTPFHDFCWIIILNKIGFDYDWAFVWSKKM